MNLPKLRPPNLSADTADFQKRCACLSKRNQCLYQWRKTHWSSPSIGIPKTEFTPKDIYLAVGFMSFGFAEGLRVDPVYCKNPIAMGQWIFERLWWTLYDAVRIPSHKGDIKTQGQLISAFNEAFDAIPFRNGWAVMVGQFQEAKHNQVNLSFPTTHTLVMVSLLFGTKFILEYPGFSFTGIIWLAFLWFVGAK